MKHLMISHGSMLCGLELCLLFFIDCSKYLLLLDCLMMMMYIGHIYLCLEFMFHYLLFCLTNFRRREYGMEVSMVRSCKVVSEWQQVHGVITIRFCLVVVSHGATTPSPLHVTHPLHHRFFKLFDKLMSILTSNCPVSALKLDTKQKLE